MTLDQTAPARSHVQDNINDYWTSRAPAYDDFQLRPERLAADQAAWRTAVADVLPPAPADVLDLGTGSGYLAFVLASLGHRVTATDLATGMLDRAREHAAAVEPAPVFRHGDAVAPDFAEEAFDAITNRYLMWTLRDPATALANWRRLLRPGGVLAVVDSTWFPDGFEASSATDASSDFARLYDADVQRALPLATSRSIDETRDLIAAAGFGEVRVVPLTSILELDRVHGVAPGHHVQTKYLVRAVRD